MDPPASAQKNVDTLTSTDLEAFKSAFEFWDKDGAVTVSDMGHIFQTVGLNVDADELRKIQTSLDVGGESGGTINFPALLDQIGISFSFFSKI